MACSRLLYSNSLLDYSNFSSDHSETFVPRKKKKTRAPKNKKATHARIYTCLPFSFMYLPSRYELSHFCEYSEIPNTWYELLLFLFLFLFLLTLLERQSHFRGQNYVGF